MSTHQTKLIGSLDDNYRGVDGAGRLDREPTAAELRWGITSDELHRRHMMSPDPTAPNESFCDHCRSRITTLKNGVEAGHAAGWRDPICHRHPNADSDDRTLTEIECLE